MGNGVSQKQFLDYQSEQGCSLIFFFTLVFVILAWLAISYINLKDEVIKIEESIITNVKQNAK